MNIGMSPELKDTVCPFLGAWWDRSTPHSYVTEENRCFATETTKRYLLVFTKKVAGGGVSLDHQREFCFADYAICPRYVARKS